MPKEQVSIMTLSPRLQTFSLRAAAAGLMFFLPVSVIPSSAQTSATIAGTVQDQSGGLVSEASVTAVHSETGLSRSNVTSVEGRFIFSSLPVGLYEIRVTHPGFRPLVRQGVRLEVGAVAALDLRLEVGGVDLVLNVVGEVPVVNTQTSELSYMVSEGLIRDLPLNGRNYSDLALLQPGVIPFPHRDGGSVVAHGLGVSINGQDPRSNVYLLDGTPQNDFTNGPAGSAASTALGMETVREFRVEVNAYSAEFGRNSGGQINALTKSGTNELHGSLYQFHRNDNLDARNFFDQARKPEFRRNQFGGTLGGPFRRERTFFFVGYEALREGLGKTISTLVPDANARRGLLPNPTDPTVIDEVGVHPAVRSYLEAYPSPNDPVPDLQLARSGLARHNFLFSQRLDEDFLQGRVDHNFGPGHQFFGRYTIDDAQQKLPTDFPQFPREFLSRNQFFTAEYRRIFSPRLLNDLRLNFSRTRIGQDVQAELSSPLQPFVPGQQLVGAIDIGGLPRFGPQTSVNVKLTQNVFGVEDGLTYTRGRHLLKFGGLAERYQDNMFNPTFSLGIYNFAGLRDFLLNRPQLFIGLRPDGALDRYWRFTLTGFYLQDSIRVHPRFQLNLGLRYEFSTMPVDLYGRDSSLIRLTDSEPTVGPLYRNPTYRNISPRFGFAWDAAGDGRTALRGGYGLFFNTNNQQNLIVTVTNPPATPRIIIRNPSFPLPPFERGQGNSIRPVEWNLKNPNVHVWNLNLQREFWYDTLLTVGYAGSRGIHLLRSGDVNVPVPERLADGRLFFAPNLQRPNPAFTTIELKRSDGDSWYNAMILELRKRWSQGVSFQSSYTFSRNIDNTQASTFFSDATNGTTSAFPEFPGFFYNRGLSDFHAKHNWVANFTWELPFGRDSLGAARRWLGGWQLSGIGTVRSGSPLTVFVQRNRSRSLWAPSLGPGIGSDRAGLAAGRTHESAVLGGPDQYFDPSAFQLQAAGTLGTLGRGTFVGPDLRTFDFSVVKNFEWARLGEDTRIQFRTEIFNLFNRSNFAPPSLIAFTGQTDNEQPLASLGRIRATTTSARQIQFGLRIVF
ncbi:MAG: TonB-dependent receptor [Acidobacteriota bacterium]